MTSRSIRIFFVLAVMIVGATPSPSSCACRKRRRVRLQQPRIERIQPYAPTQEEDSTQVALLLKAYKELEAYEGYADIPLVIGGKKTLLIATWRLNAASAKAIVEASLITGVMIDVPLEPSVEAMLRKAFVLLPGGDAETTVWERRR